MGIDAEIYAIGECDDDTLAAAEVFVWQRIDGSPVAWKRPCLERCTDYDGQPIVSMLTLCRYYGPGYERGPWPAIYAAIKAMQAAFPTHAVRYTGDVSMEGTDPFDDEDAQAIWAHWLGPKWDAYHEHWRRWSADHP